MQIKSLLPFPADVVLIGRTVEPGEVVDVTDEQAAALLAQVGNWEAVEPVKSSAKPTTEEN